MNDEAPERLPRLDSLIAAALAESDQPDPHTVIDSVMVAIGANVEHYMRQAIASRIASVVGSARDAATPVPVRKGVSTKQSLIRDEYWPRFLRQRIFLADGYKFLAEATSDDLRAAAAHRQAQAQELMVKADQFASLADLMDRAKVKHLEQLDPSAGQRVLERAA